MIRLKLTHTLTLTLLSMTLSSASVQAQYTPWAQEDYPQNLYWGDTHVHSAFSMDANTMGNTALPPADAYRFARGEAVTANNGMVAKLRTPLDFLVVSDHAEQMGIMMKLREGDPRLMKNDHAKRIRAAMMGETGADAAGEVMMEFLNSMSRGEPMIDSPEVSMDVWQELIRQADAFNEPGLFTALIGFEWTSMPKASNLHRVVVYRDDASRAGQLQPQSSNDGERPEDLWDFMDRYEEVTDGSILAIPHNGNLSNGLMFQTVDSEGKAIDSAYASRRANREPIVEVTQIKGDGEAHPFLSPDDEFADFETWDAGNFAATTETNKTPDMLQYEYARSALKSGLEIAARTGVNPYQFGMIGATDAHTSLATGAEDNYWGKATITEPGTERTLPSGFLGATSVDTDLSMPWMYGASGYAGVWARENTREALFDAMQRREVYATSGSRIALRFFGGWEYSEADLHSPDVVFQGYRKGVPMGAELAQAASKAPRFMVLAAKDPNGANLDRVQIVKGWLDANGEPREKVYDVGLSDSERARNGKSPKPVGNTVDVTNASYSNTIGAAQINSLWIDPDFKSQQRAFYYARVIEIPVPRWNVYDQKRLGKTVDERAPTSVQDRAYSSPIWYQP